MEGKEYPDLEGQREAVIGWKPLCGKNRRKCILELTGRRRKRESGTGGVRYARQEEARERFNIKWNRGEARLYKRRTSLFSLTRQVTS